MGAAFALGVALEVGFMNGAWYWKWPWRHLDPLRTAAFLAGPLIPFSLALFRIEKGAPGHRNGTLALLVAAHAAFQILGILADPRGFPLIRAIVESPVATSYFTDARKIQDLIPWMEQFPGSGLELHSSTHPPGPILFYYAWIRLLGPGRGALAGALMIGLVASAGIPVLYAFGKLWASDDRPRLLACAWYALLPAPILFFPEFDQVYPLFSMLMILAWVGALKGSRIEAALLGAVLFLATFFAYNLLAIGAFLAMYGLHALSRGSWGPEARGALLRSCGVAAGTAASLFVLLWAATGYNPVLGFLGALHTQAGLAAQLRRPWLPCAVFDLYDFFLGAGMLAAPLLLGFLDRMFDEFDLEREELVVSLIALATVLVVDLSGLLRAETARVWIFLLPLVVGVGSRELDRLGGRQRILLFGLQWLILVVLKCKMSFVDP